MFIGILVVTSTVAGLGIISMPVAAGSTTSDFEDGNNPFSNSAIRTGDAASGDKYIEVTGYPAMASVSPDNNVVIYVRPTSGNGQSQVATQDSGGNLVHNLEINKNGGFDIYDAYGSQLADTQEGVWYKLKIGTDNTLQITDTRDGTTLYSGSLGTGSGSGVSDIFADQGVDLDLLKVDETPLRTVNGTVQDASGQALTNAGIRVMESSGSLVDSATTDENGTFSIEARGQKQVTVGSDKTGYRPASTSFTVNQSVSPTLTLSEQTDPATGKVLTGFQEPATGALIEVRDDTGTVVETTRVDGNGTYSVGSDVTNGSVRASGSDYVTNDTAYVDTVNGASIPTLYLEVEATPRDGYAEDVTDPIIHSDYRQLNTESVVEKCGGTNTDTATTIAEDRHLIDLGSMTWQGWDGIGPDEVACEVEADSENQTRNNMVAVSAVTNTTGQTTRATMRNYLTDSRGASISEAKVNAWNALANNSTAKQAKIETNASVDGFYHAQQENLGASWSAAVEQAQYAYQEEQRVTGEVGDWVTVKTASGTVQLDHSNPFQTSTVETGHDNFTITTFRTANGNVVTPFPSSTTAPNGGPYVQGPVLQVSADPVATAEDQGDGTGAYTTLARSSDYNGIVSTIDTQNQQTKDNAAKVIDDVYTNYTAENITEANATDFLTPNEIASRAASDYNSTGYYSYSAVQLAASGYGGNVTAAHVIELGDGTRKEGALFYTGFDDLAKFERNKTYDPADYNGTFLIATNDGTETIGQPFEIVEQYNTKTGNTTENATVEQYTYETTDVTGLSDQLDGLSELQTAYDSADTRTILGGGGGGSGGSLVGGDMAMFALVFLGVIILVGSLIN
ncbi:carboxypeptidase-like regulatory domain-containing protein [Haloarcula montana]|uniref:carboxypeptidase-like regulatory domain-containing protein n=1 Tax=Haloarcula montana TaxID=3111776 RepID=UPI002D7973B6|nr:carboxypeptidase-like regulatory domain-containing protein [Haloarcula sp. GH36]